MVRRTIPAHEPSARNKAIVDRTTRLLLWPARAALETMTPLRWRGREHLPPPEHPALILSNHVSLFDPWFTIAAAGRTVHFLATAAAMRDPLMGVVLRSFGSIPKKKFTADPGAIRAMKKWVELGAMVGSYPEGERSWDGELLPLLPGIEALVRLLDVPVVPVRVLNADRVFPRWAERRRHGTVTVEFDAPRSFDRKTARTELRGWLEDRLRVDQGDERNHAPVRGRELALGLDNPLFRCPRCFAWNGLVASGDHVRCRECAAIWRVTTRNELIAEGGGARSVRIVQARAAIRSRNVAEGFRVDDRVFDRDGVVATSEPAGLLDVSDTVHRPLGRARMVLTPTCLRFVGPDGAERLRLELAELVNANLELRRVLALRDKRDRVYEVDLPRESPLMWAELIEHWRTCAP